MDEAFLSTDVMKSYIDKMLRGEGNELDAYISTVSEEININGTSTLVRCYMVNFNGQDYPRGHDLGRVLVDYLIDYSLPRNEIRNAQLKDLENNTTKNVAALNERARRLFTSISKTGEPGEVLLYLLAQNVLKLPQAVAKMSLKTNPELHYNGADGVHLGYTPETQKLNIYWGEAKFYQQVGEAIKKCFESLYPFLAPEEDARIRDLELLTSRLNTLDEGLAKAIINYLNPDHPNFNKLECRGICLIGFDYSKYPLKQRTKKQQEVLQEIVVDTQKWLEKLSVNINLHNDLNKMIVEVFLLPMPSVQGFRDAFLEVLNRD